MEDFNLKLLALVSKIECAIDRHAHLTRVALSGNFHYRAELTYSSEGWTASCHLRYEGAKGRGSRQMHKINSSTWMASAEDAVENLLSSLEIWAETLKG